MLFRSIEMPARTYPSLGRCIFCGTTEQLTDEHIVPEALTGVGELKIALGSCRTCNNYANETYEHKALANDFLPVRYMLHLKRKRRGRKTRPPMIPGFASNPDLVDLDSPESEGFDLSLGPDEAPPLAQFMMHPPAGLLTGEDKSMGSPSFRMQMVHLGKPVKEGSPNRFAKESRLVMGAPEMLVAKMAYCFAVAEYGLDFDRYTALRDLLRGKRGDVFNFVGQPIKKEKLATKYLHGFYFRKRLSFHTMLIHLFASFGGPVYEVVLEPKDKINAGA